ncbi:MAG: YfhO family protein [Lentilactobacillus hilgardii]|mgnify:CR=1 FL=1|uniref:YfhO family protein n=1 Tax=Lentilactobacillus hilgardii TaxID=1588 RepID=UPI001CC21E07|nr:YfhO family protein [Lentilactobacillus hilgardii]MBZ2200250.1 hypothetical protein [Lentilactobacillus hilgardii]MBZ2203374.1 hypothetical protein [Lentilactobacillus hilgardii]
MKSKRNTLIISFLAPLIIVTCYFIYRQFAPFGSSSVMTVDMGQQYIDFFTYFRTTLLHNPGGIFYSFNKALGGDMLGTWSYYLMSPLNLLILLFPLSKLPAVVGVITILKYALAGLTAGYMFIKLRKTTGWMVVAFSTCYALMGWMVANQLNTIWVDGVILLPLIYLGLTHILSGGSGKLYIISLAAILMINYYIGWMIAIFVSAYVVVFTLCKAYQTSTSYLKVFLKWLGASLISGALSAWILIPTFYALLKSKSDFSQSPFFFTFEYNPIRMIAKFVNGAFDFTQLPKGTPNIFVGSIVLIMCLYYFFAPSIKKRLKIANGLLLVFLILSMCFEPLDVIWHGLALPVWYPYRFSFIFSFLMILIAFSALQDILKNGLSWLGFDISLGIIVLGFVYIAIAMKKFEFLTIGKLVTGIVFLILAVLLLFFWNRFPKKAFFPLLLFLLVGAEMGTNLTVSLATLGYLDAADYTEFSTLMREASAKTKKMDPGFYRTAATFSRTRNDAMTGNFYGGSVFSSTLETATTNFYNNIGNPSGTYYAVYSNGTVFTDSLLSMKYYFTPRHVKNKVESRRSLNYLTPLTSRPDLVDYSKKAHTSLINIYKNPYALPLGFLSRRQFMFPINNMNETAAYQNQIASQLDPRVGNLFSSIRPAEVTYDNAYPAANFSNSQIRKKDKTEPAGLTLTIPVKKHTSYYMSLGPRMTQDTLTYLVDNKPLQQYRTSAKETLLNFATGTNKNRTVHLQILANVNHAPLENVFLYALDNNKVKQLSTDLKKNSYKVTKYTDRSITGTIASPSDDRTMTTTIPYSKGWSATVDGKNVTPKRWANMFMYINVNKGKHTVKFTYTPVGFKSGLTISLVALIGLIGLCGYQFYRRKKVTDIKSTH